MTTASIGGSWDSAMRGVYQRRGPTQSYGEARSLHTGSVSTRWPSISISIAAWPSHVTRRPVAGAVAKRAGSIASVGTASFGLAYGLAWNIAVIAPQASFHKGCG